MKNPENLPLGHSKAHIRERSYSDKKSNGYGYTEGRCKSIGCVPERRKSLPKKDLKKFNEPEPAWLEWKPLDCVVSPGYYWVCAPGVWPQIVKFEFVKGFLVPVDPHSANRSSFWQRAAGPIPDPVNPFMLNHRTEGRR